jgi:hypothetical protein
MDNEVSIKLRLDTSELKSGGDISRSARTSAFAAGASSATTSARSPARKAAQLNEQFIDFDKLESRLNRKLLKFGVRAGIGLGFSSIADEMGAGGNFFTRMGTNIASGLIFGGGTGAIISTIMTTIHGIAASIKDNSLMVSEIDKKIKDNRREVLLIVAEMKDREREREERAKTAGAIIVHNIDKKKMELQYEMARYIPQ